MKKDYIGVRYPGSRLVITEEIEPYYYEEDDIFIRRFKCKCDCGNETTSLIGNLRSGATRSCGCLRRETMRKTASKRKEDDSA